MGKDRRMAVHTNVRLTGIAVLKWSSLKIPVDLKPVNFRPAQLAEERVEAKSLTAETTAFPNPLTFIFSEFRSY